MWLICLTHNCDFNITKLTKTHTHTHTHHDIVESGVKIITSVINWTNVTHFFKNVFMQFLKIYYYVFCMYKFIVHEKKLNDVFNMH